MTVNVTKPAVDVRQKLAELDMPTGIAGRTMLAAATPREQFNSINAGRKNLLHNSQFMISQRGDYETSAVAVAAGSPTYGVDRWATYANGKTVSQQIINTTLPTGEYVKSHKTVFTHSTSQSWLHPFQKIEPERWMRGKYITLSCWVKTNIDGYKIRICDTINCYMIGDFIPPDGQWHYMTATHRLPDNMSLHEDNVTNNIQIQPAFQTTARTLTQNTSFVEFALMQAEIGKEATPFDYRTYAEEFQICQRYYQRIGAGLNGTNNASDYTNVASAFATSSAWYVPIILPGGRMRTTPTVSVSSVSDWRCTLQHSHTDACTSIQYGYADTLNPTLSVQAGSNSASNGTRMFGYNGQVGAWLAFSADY